MAASRSPATVSSSRLSSTAYRCRPWAGTVTTGANGSYNFLLPPGTILASGSQVLTYTTGANAGAAYRQNATGSVTNLNIYEGYLNETGGATTLSGLSAGLATALGSNSSVVNGLN